MYKLKLLISAINSAESACEVIYLILPNDSTEKKDDILIDKKDYDRLIDKIEILKNAIDDIKRVFN